MMDCAGVPSRSSAHSSAGVSPRNAGATTALRDAVRVLAHLYCARIPGDTWLPQASAWSPHLVLTVLIILLGVRIQVRTSRGARWRGQLRPFGFVLAAVPAVPPFRAPSPSELRRQLPAVRKRDGHPLFRHGSLPCRVRLERRRRHPSIGRVRGRVRHCRRLYLALAVGVGLVVSGFRRGELDHLLGRSRDIFVIGPVCGLAQQALSSRSPSCQWFASWRDHHGSESQMISRAKSSSDGRFAPSLGWRSLPARRPQRSNLRTYATSPGIRRYARRTRTRAARQ